MNTLEEMQTAAFQIITYAGEARSNYVEAIRIARAGEIEEARQKITEVNRQKILTNRYFPMPQ